jgi:hypothetical protein
MLPAGHSLQLWSQHALARVDSSYSCRTCEGEERGETETQVERQKGTQLDNVTKIKNENRRKNKENTERKKIKKSDMKKGYKNRGNERGRESGKKPEI